MITLPEYPARFIPTCVGSAPLPVIPATILAVHPHVCGERTVFTLSALRYIGSSPRVWGAP